MTRQALSFSQPVGLGLLTLAVLFLGVGVWAATAQLSGAIIAQGRIVAEGRNIPVAHPEGGLVAEVLVKEGDTVRPGQVLLRLKDAALRSEAAVIQTRLSELAARIARLEAERDGSPAPTFPPELLAEAAVNPDIAAELRGQQDLMAARAATEAELTAQLGARKAQASARLSGLHAQAAALDDLNLLLEADLARVEPLYRKGLVPLAEFSALQREGARLAGESGELAATIAGLREQMAEIDLQLASRAAQRREEAIAELREVWPLRLELEERARELADRIARLDLRAPAAGVVLGLMVAHPGAVLRPGDPALHLVPDGGLHVSVRVAPHSIASIAAGQKADLAFPAVDLEPATRLAGRVTRISADVIVDPQTGLGAYEVTVALPPDLEFNAQGGMLQPGMPVDVYLETGTRRAITYLVEPFTDYFLRALREG